MGIEALAEAAKLLFPDRQIGAIEDVNFLVPFKFYRGQPRTVSLHAHFRACGRDIIAHCRLDGARTLHGQPQPEITTHFTARVRLVEDPPASGKRGKIAATTENKVQSGDIYRIYFHGPAYQVVESSWRQGDELVGLLAEHLPANHEPEDLPTAVPPRLIELCFQTSSLWEMAAHSRLGLPHKIGQVRILGDPDRAKTRLYSLVTSNEDGSFDAQVADEKGNIYLALNGYQTMALPEAIDPSLLRPVQAALA